jgi:hypothetical protein
VPGLQFCNSWEFVVRCQACNSAIRGNSEFRCLACNSAIRGSSVPGLQFCNSWEFGMVLNGPTVGVRSSRSVNMLVAPFGSIKQLRQFGKKRWSFELRRRRHEEAHRSIVHQLMIRLRQSQARPLHTGRDEPRGERRSPERTLARPMLLRRFGCDPYWRPLESLIIFAPASLRALRYSASLRETIPSECQWSAFTPGRQVPQRL